MIGSCLIINLWAGFEGRQAVFLRRAHHHHNWSHVTSIHAPSFQNSERLQFFFTICQIYYFLDTFSGTINSILTVSKYDLQFFSSEATNHVIKFMFAKKKLLISQWGVVMMPKVAGFCGWTNLMDFFIYGRILKKKKQST